MLYEAEVRYFPSKEIEIYEKHHRVMASNIQGLPSNCPYPVSLSTLGWVSLTAFIDQVKLLFMWRLLTRSYNHAHHRFETLRCK